MAKETLVSLRVKNLSNVTRLVGKNGLRGHQAGLIGFETFKQVKYAVKLHKATQIRILDEIPQWVQDNIGEVTPDGTEESPIVAKSYPLSFSSNGSKEAPKAQPTKSTQEKVEEEAAPTATPSANTGDEETVATDETATTDETADETETTSKTETTNDETNDQEPESTELPEWFLEPEKVQQLSRKDLLAHFSDVEEVSLPGNASADDTKKKAHNQMAELFPENYEAPTQES